MNSRLVALLFLSLLPLLGIAQREKGYRVRELARGGDSAVVEVVVRNYSFNPREGAVVPTIAGAPSVSPVGSPELPNITIGYATASEQGLRLRVDVVEKELLGKYAIAARRLRTRKGGGNTERDKTTARAPEQFVSLGQVGKRGDEYRQGVSISPFVYQESSQALFLAKRVVYTVHGVQKPSAQMLGGSSIFGKGQGEGYMLLVTPKKYLASLKEYIHWKQLNGQAIRILVYGEESVGLAHVANQEELKHYIRTAYKKDRKLRYVLLVGNRSEIPPQLKPGTNKNLVDCDQPYGMLEGVVKHGIEQEDGYNEVAVGRYSCYSSDELGIQLTRTMEYERGSTLKPTAYTQALCIGSGDEFTGDNNETDIQHQTRIAELLRGHGYTEVFTLLGDKTTTAAQVVDYVDRGVGLINYSGHGYEEHWKTTSFSVKGIRRLRNQGSYPFVMDVACDNGRMEHRGCFAEQWLWAQQAGQPTGAIGILASSDQQNWNPPMLAQDALNEYIAGTRKDCKDYSLGGLCSQSMAVMEDKYGSSVDSEGYVVAIAWNLFGDPSTLLRTRSPRKAKVKHTQRIFSNAAIYIYAAGEGLGSTLCVRHRDGSEEFYYSMLKGANTSYSSLKYKAGDRVKIAVWGHNYETYVSEWMLVEPGGGSGSGIISEYKIYFRDEEGGAIEGVRVQLGGETLTTNAEGVVYYMGAEGAYKLQTQSEWYTDLDKEIELEAANPELELVLERAKAEELKVIFLAGNGERLRGLAISLNGEEYRTDRAGSISLQLTPGDYVVRFRNAAAPALPLQVRKGQREIRLTLFDGLTELAEERGSPRIMPNPAHDIVRVVTTGNADCVRVYDLQGHKVHTQQIPANGTAALDLGRLARGLYILRIGSSQGSPLILK